MYKNLMVPLDGSAFGEQALAPAIDIARRANGSLRLTHVRTPVAAIYAETPLFVQDDLEYRVGERDRLRWQEYLDGVAARVREAAPSVPVATKLLDGETAESLQHEAETHGVDLVVMTTHARGAVGRFWLGSVTDELLRHSHIPMYVTGPVAQPPTLGSEVLPRHVVIPLDGTPLAEQMIRPAVEFGKLSRSAFTLYRVIKPVVATAPSALVGAGLGQMAFELVQRLQAIQSNLRNEAQQYLEKIAAPLRGEGLKVLTSVSQEEQPAVAILNEAETDGAGLVALATHGRRGLSRFVLGSVADKVVRGSKSPVLLCRPRV